MRIAVVGGRLQGVEAVYLAHKARLEAVVIDKDRPVPASGLCDEFLQLDIIKEPEKVIRSIRGAGLIVPALEDRAALCCLEKIAERAGVPLAFDAPSYQISSSKIESDRVFAERGIPSPAYWPGAGLPVIAKPSGASGSKGVVRISHHRDLEKFLQGSPNYKDHWVIQEYLPGDSYSLEVMGSRGKYVTFQITGLEVDENYDCKRVRAPAGLGGELEKQFRDTAVRIAEAVGLTGIMDVEAISHNGVLKVLEIDARLPSQTPTAVYKSTGINLLEQLYRLYAEGVLTGLPEAAEAREVIYEHIRVTPEGIATLGEHIMADAGPLGYYENLWGADEVLTDYREGCKYWAATLILAGSGRDQIWSRRCQVIENIKKQFKLPVYVDSVLPEGKA